MDDKDREFIELANTSNDRIESHIFLARKAEDLLRDFVLIYEEGQNQDQMNILYNEVVDVLFLLKGIRIKTREYLESIDV